MNTLNIKAFGGLFGLIVVMGLVLFISVLDYRFHLSNLPLYIVLLGALFVYLVIFPVLVWRLIDEEKFLTKNLPGYKEYKNKIKYHLIPFVW